MLELGIKAPDFELPDQNGEMHKLSDYAGIWRHLCLKSSSLSISKII